MPSLPGISVGCDKRAAASIRLPSQPARKHEERRDPKLPPAPAHHHLPRAVPRRDTPENKPTILPAAANLYIYNIVRSNAVCRREQSLGIQRSTAV